MVIGISGDSVSSLNIFRTANHLNFTLLSDPDGKIAKLFGVPVRAGGTFTKMVDGKEVVFTRAITASRWTFIIDKAGSVIYKNSEVIATQDSRDVLSVLNHLQK